jgi:hypothetical protein
MASNDIAKVEIERLVKALADAKAELEAVRSKHRGRFA